MKHSWKTTLAMVLLSAAVGAQTQASGSTSAGASVTPGQAAASAGTNQNAQAGGASASVNGSTSAQASRPDANNGSAHDHSAKEQNGQNSLSLANGTTLQAELIKPVDAKKARPGDQVTAKLTQDAKSGGKVVLHKGSKLIGHVTEAQARSKEQTESRLGILFDKAELKGGQEASINAVIQAIAPPVQGAAVASGNDNLSSPTGSGAPRTGPGGPMGGVVGAAGSTVSGATGAVTNTTGAVTGGLDSTVNSTAGAATGSLNAQGALSSTSHGVIGLQGLTLSSVTAASSQASVITSPTHNVKLDSGTQLLLQVSGNSN